MNKKIFLYHSEVDILEDKYDYMDIKKLDDIEDDSISSDLFIFDLLDSVSLQEADSILKKINNKILSKTTLEVQSIDIFSISSSLLNKHIDIEMYNNMIFSTGKKHIKSLERVTDLLRLNNFSILETKFINGIQYYVKAEK
jgi:hypothetical protein